MGARGTFIRRHLVIAYPCKVRGRRFLHLNVFVGLYVKVLDKIGLFV